MNAWCHKRDDRDLHAATIPFPLCGQAYFRDEEQNLRSSGEQRSCGHSPSDLFGWYKSSCNRIDLFDLRRAQLKLVAKNSLQLAESEEGNEHHKREKGLGSGHLSGGWLS